MRAFTWLLPACERWCLDSWPDVKHRRVLRVASQPPVVSEATAMVPPFAGGAVFAALPSVFAGSCQVFLSLSGSVFPVAIGGMAGMTASAAGSGGAVCPSTSAAGAITVGAVTAMPAGAGGPPAPLRCMVCLACLARRGCLARLVCLARLMCLVCLAGLSLLCQGAPALVGVAVARPVVGSTGETWLRWQFPSPMASSRRSGSLPVILGTRFWTRFFHPLLVAPSLEAPQRGSCRLVDCCLASLWAGVCGLP